MQNLLPLATYPTYRFILSCLVVFFMCFTSGNAQNSVVDLDSLLQGSSRLLLSNHQEKALKILVPLYYEELKEERTDSSFQELVYQFARILERTDQYQTALEVSEKWIETGLFLPYYIARLHVLKAVVFEKIEQPEQCVEELDKAKKLIAKHKWPELYAEYLVRRSSYHRIYSDIDSARYYAGKALPAAQKAGSRWNIADAYLLLGFMESEPEAAYKSLRSALAEYKALNDTDGIGFMYLNFFSLYYESNEVLKALAFLDSTGLYARGSNFIRLKASYQSELAYYYEDTKDYNRALEAFKASTALLSKLDEQQKQAVLYSQKYNANHVKQQELYQLKEKSEAERESLTDERNTIALFLFLLVAMLVIILYLYYLKRSQGKTILEDRKLIQLRNKELEDLLSRNELLLSELHHRVKNNLQFIISMISLQMESSESTVVKDVLESVLTRVGAIASVHEKLYQNPQDGMELDQSVFIENILTNLHNFINIEGVTLNVDFYSLLLDTSRTIALGMIITELVTNSQKHAFEDNVEVRPTIIIKLNKEPTSNLITLNYQDNGTGTKSPHTEGMGMRLIRLFAKQLKGNPVMEFENGFKLTMKFPIERHGE